MSILASVVGFQAKDVQSTIISILVGVATIILLYLVRFYSNLSKYPKGPMPLPFLGNIRLFKGRMAIEVMNELAKQYGDVYTLWLGPTANIIVSNDAINDALITRKNDFAGRPQFFFAEIMLTGKGSADVIFEDWGRPWEVLRRVAHTAARKFAVSPKLPAIEVQVVDEVVDLIMAREGLNKPFNPKDYIYLMVYSIIASIAAGKTYSIDDKEFLAMKDANDITLKLQSNLAVIEFFPLLRFFPYQRMWSKLVDAVNVNKDWCRRQVEQHLADYAHKNVGLDGTEVKDFCDAVINAKMEAESTDSLAAPHLTPDNLKNVVLNLFQAGTETTRMTMNWAFLLIANFQNVQKKMRKEIDEIIGDGIPTNDHRIKCHYVQAVIAEVMRFSPIAATGVPRKAICDSEITGRGQSSKVETFKIPKGTTVLANLLSQLHDPKVWGDPRSFRPERFLEPNTGNFNARMNESNHPFSVGRRACLGEKLALMNFFIEISRFLQKTKGYMIVLKDGEGSVSLEPDRNLNTHKYCNVEHEIMIVKE